MLDQPLTAFFASRKCSGKAIRAAMAWAIEQARSKSPVISGFHSPLEQSVLEVMFAAGAPCVMVIARKLEQTHLPSAWLRAAQCGTAAIVSMDDTTRRLTAELAARITIAHTSAEGSLLQHAVLWGREGRIVNYLS